MFAKLKHWNRRRDTINQLKRLSSRELKDIGITRGDICSVAAGIYE